MIFRKRALYSVALLRKTTCNFGILRVFASLYRTYVELRRKVWIKEEGDRVSECTVDTVDSIVHTLPTENVLLPTSATDILHTCSWTGESCIKEKVNRVSECVLHCVIHTIYPHPPITNTVHLYSITLTLHTYIYSVTLNIHSLLPTPYTPIFHCPHPTHPSSITHTLRTCISSINLNTHNRLPPPYTPIFYYVFYYPKYP